MNIEKTNNIKTFIKPNSKLVEKWESLKRSKTTWWMWFLSATNGLFPFIILKLKTRIVSIKGMLKIEKIKYGKFWIGIINKSCLTEEIVKSLIVITAIKKPNIIDPVSPIKILEDFDMLNLKNAIIEPINTMVTKNKLYSFKMKKIIEKVEKIIIEIIPANPSIPSIKFIELMIVTMIKIDNANAKK